MLAFGIICALVATASAGYASSSSTGYSSAGGSAGGFPFYQGFPPFQSPFELQAAYQQYFNHLSALNAKLYQQQWAHQQALFNSIRNQALGGAGAYAGGSVGSYGATGPSGTYGGTYGGPVPHGGGAYYAPNYAASGGSVGPVGTYQHASIYPASPVRPNLDSRFSSDDAPGVTTYYNQGPPGVVGVSSFSSSSDVNGQRHRESATSVQKDGKVTTYHVRN